MSKDNGVNLADYNVGDIVKVTRYNCNRIETIVRITGVEDRYLEADYVRGDFLRKYFNDIVLNNYDVFEKITVEPEEEADNAIEHPKHYTQGGVEVIDIIDDAVQGAKPSEAVYQANILKYILRYRHKNGVEDVKKAIWYAERLVTLLEAGDKR